MHKLLAVLYVGASLAACSSNDDDNLFRGPAVDFSDLEDTLPEDLRGDTENRVYSDAAVPPAE